MNDYSHILSLSGCSETERYSNIKGVLDRVDVMTREVEAGVCDSRFRTGDQIRAHKIEKGGLTPATWFLKGNIGSTISCQATLGSKLAGLLQTKAGQGSNGEKVQTAL